jgi:endoglucanase
VSGTITNLWSANVAEADGQWAFTGVEWNATLEPGATTSFGFCASR